MVIFQNPSWDGSRILSIPTLNLMDDINYMDQFWMPDYERGLLALPQFLAVTVNETQKGLSIACSDDHVTLSAADRPKTGAQNHMFIME